jgi:hypothetical protein
LVRPLQDLANVIEIGITVADLERIVRQRVRYEVGRAKINAKRRAALETRTAAVRREYDRDLIAKHPAHGRTVRLARKLHIPRSTVARILSQLLKCPL